MMIECKRLYMNGEPTKYIVYSDGSVYSEFSNKFLKPFLNPNGYCLVDINHNHASKYYQVHRLVAELFIPNPDNLETVNHKNGIKTDNRVENLEWLSNVDNIRHAWATGLAKPRYGEDNPANVYTLSQIREVCMFLELGLATNKEISEMTGVSVDTIVDIKYRGKWKQISEQYCFLRTAPVSRYRIRKAMIKLVEMGYDADFIKRALYPGKQEEKFLEKLIKKRSNAASTTIPQKGSTPTS